MRTHTSISRIGKSNDACVLKARYVVYCSYIFKYTFLTRTHWYLIHRGWWLKGSVWIAYQKNIPEEMKSIDGVRKAEKRLERATSEEHLRAPKVSLVSPSFLLSILRPSNEKMQSFLETIREDLERLAKMLGSGHSK